MPCRLRSICSRSAVRRSAPRRSESGGRRSKPSFTCALNFSNCITFSMRSARNCVGGAFVGAAVGEPAHQRRRIDPGQNSALGVEIEIGRRVAGCAPHRIDRAVDQLRAKRRMRRQRQERSGTARGFLVRTHRFDARHDRGSDALADLHGFEIHRRKRLFHLRIGALRKRLDQAERALREKPRDRILVRAGFLRGADQDLVA